MTNTINMLILKIAQQAYVESDLHLKINPFRWLNFEILGR